VNHQKDKSMALFDDLPTGASPVDAATDIKSINETTEAFSRKVTKLQELVGQKRDALWASRQSDVERAGVVETDGETRTVDKDRRAQELRFIERGINDELRKFRAELDDSSGQERFAMLQSLESKLQRLEAIAETYPNATAWLSRSGRGSTEHANLVGTFVGAGKAELTAAAREAVISGNKILASAVVIAIERLPRHERPFPALELAQRMVGPEHTELLNSIAAARDRVKAAIELNSAFERGGESAAAKIERGLRARQAAGRAKATA
jgi:hypothetical protein